MSPLPMAGRAPDPTPGQWSRTRAVVWFVLMLALGGWVLMILRA